MRRGRDVGDMQRTRVQALSGHEALQDLGGEAARTAAKRQSFSCFGVVTFAPL